MNQIPYLTLTAGQQGGIGYPPVIVKLDQWCAVSDSRDRKSPPELEQYLESQYRISDYGFNKSIYWHGQEFVQKKWHNAPQLTWDEVLSYVKKKIRG